MSYWWLFLFCPVSYLIGGINFSIIISRNILKDNVRSHGSGNPGATNMLRSYGFKWGLLVLIGDMLKAAIPAFIGFWCFGDHNYSLNPFASAISGDGLIGLYSCGLSAVVGHCFPVFYHFHGGKGVSSVVGVFAVANPVIGLGGLAFGMVLGMIFEYASVSSITFITIAALWQGFLLSHGLTVSIVLAVFYFLVLFTHRKNIYRLLAGCENRASLFKKRSKYAQNKIPIKHDREQNLSN